MDGYDALQYSRLRYIDSDWKRIERQRNVIQAVVHKAKDLSLLELNDVANTILPMINTNLSKTEILDLVLFAVFVAKQVLVCYSIFGNNICSGYRYCNCCIKFLHQQFADFPKLL